MFHRIADREADASDQGRRGASEVAAEVAAALMWGPKTAGAVLEAVSPRSKNTALVQKYIDQFVASGCAYQCGVSAWRSPIYAWNAKPFAHLDRPAPPPQGEKP